MCATTSLMRDASPIIRNLQGYIYEHLRAYLYSPEDF